MNNEQILPQEPSRRWGNRYVHQNIGGNNKCNKEAKLKDYEHSNVYCQLEESGTGDTEAGEEGRSKTEITSSSTSAFFNKEKMTKSGWQKWIMNKGEEWEIGCKDKLVLDWELSNTL